ncbi:organic solute transporter Ostalpha-domain-containing protein [Dichomitus squalens]|uniref:Organic solute transporter Ostalpha-domain-containing protein n=1 Tax=Dichomitus squalens TaxID=114155 RepID=A0A4Q9PS82_9APHY|nr:organic solute transporter Ostalpha-domain-containing protein [Dichomitus squalens]
MKNTATVSTTMFPKLGHGSGSALPLPILLVAGVCTGIATFVSVISIVLHLKNYRKPHLQRQVVRIMLMVPLYAIASFISLFSLQAAFFIDAVRDIYEAFVIYCFFDLLIAYLGGERSLLILLHGRPPKYPVFPGNLVWREVDVSDPHTFLFLKRGVIQYVQLKPLLAIATIVLKALGKYNEGDLAAGSGYLYISIVYNFSICLALYCLAIFWMCVNDDLKPFRPMPKFLCVKGILFFSFWQSIFISILVAGGAIKKLGPYTDSEHISLGLTDTLICFEMPLFAIAHMYAFATRDYVDPHASYVARLPVFYAFKDAFGLKDVVEDVKTTLRGEGMDYREFEPSEGHIHQGAGRDRRIRAGLRYSQGGKRKYWLPQPATSAVRPGPRIPANNGDSFDEVHAPLLPDQEAEVVHTAAGLRSPDEGFSLFASSGLADEGYGLPFDDVDEADEELFEHSKKYLFGDYNYPCVDVSSERARKTMWIEEERILRDEHSAWYSPLNGPRRHPGGYGATGNTEQLHPDNGKGKIRGSGPEIIIDKETERLSPPPGHGEVQLRWTSAKATPVHSPPALQSPVQRAQGALSRTSSASPHTPVSSSSKGSPRNLPPPSPRSDSERPVLPPDAVDLVVEDPHAAEEEMTHERRKGEPAVRGGGALHRVYRRGYVVEEDGRREEGEVQVDPASAPFPWRGHGVFDVGEEEEDPEEVLEAEQRVAEATARTVVRAETPPSHVHVVVDVPEDNPWA